MGLDMYLRASKYVSGYDFNKQEEIDLRLKDFSFYYHASW